MLNDKTPSGTRQFRQKTLIALIGLAAACVIAGFVSVVSAKAGQASDAPISAAEANTQVKPSESCSTKTERHLNTIELFSSEGCDSCPPADRAMSQLAKYGATNDNSVALAWHVDYWDYIGWKDVFAQPEYAQRQRELAKVAAFESDVRSTVYTPQFFVDGKVAGSNALGIRTYLRNALPNANIALTQNGRDLAVSVKNARSPGGHPLKLQVLLTENEVRSPVTAGENRGVVLQHHHLVRKQLIAKDLATTDASFNVNWPTQVNGPTIKPERSSWIVLITDSVTLVPVEVLQMQVCALR